MPRASGATQRYGSDPEVRGTAFLGAAGGTFAVAMSVVADDQTRADADARLIEAELFGDAPEPAGVRWMLQPAPAPARRAPVDPSHPAAGADAAAIAARAAAEASAAAAVAARGQLERFLTPGVPLAPVAGPPEPPVVAVPPTTAPIAAPAAWAPPAGDTVPMLVADLAPEPAVAPRSGPEPPPVARAPRHPLDRPERPLDPALEEAYFASVPLDDPDDGRRPPVRLAGEVAEHRSRWRLRRSFRRSGSGH